MFKPFQLFGTKGHPWLLPIQLGSSKVGDLEETLIEKAKGFLVSLPLRS